MFKKTTNLVTRGFPNKDTLLQKDPLKVVIFGSVYFHVFFEKLLANSISELRTDFYVTEKIPKVALSGTGRDHNTEIIF